MNTINAAALMLMYPVLSQADTAQCGWIGVQVRPMTTAFARSLGMAVPYGAIFEQPVQGSPAANAGIQKWDVVTTINGVPLGRSIDFARRISEMAPGFSISMIIFRNRETRRITLSLGASNCTDRASDGPA